MTNGQQTQVREIYLRVIEATIDNVRNELTDRSASEAVLESLNILKARWTDRLTQTHDFSDDPALVDKSSTARAAKKSTKKKGMAPVQIVPPANTKSSASSSSTAPASSSSASAAPARNGVLPVAALTNAEDDNLPAVPRVPSNLRKAEDIEETETDAKIDQPPAKRARVAPPPEDDDGVIENVGEDLDSDDSDVQGEDSDEEAENLVLAQHDRVRKGNKWKVVLREGIVCIRGREYLFNKATCDLDF